MLVINDDDCLSLKLFTPSAVMFLICMLYRAIFVLPHTPLRTCCFSIAGTI